MRLSDYIRCVGKQHTEETLELSTLDEFLELEHKVKVSIVRRVEGLQQLIYMLPESDRRHKALLKLKDFEESAEKMLTDLDIPF